MFQLWDFSVLFTETLFKWLVLLWEWKCSNPLWQVQPCNRAHTWASRGLAGWQTHLLPQPVSLCSAHVAQLLQLYPEAWCFPLSLCSHPLPLSPAFTQPNHMDLLVAFWTWQAYSYLRTYFHHSNFFLQVLYIRFIPSSLTWFRSWL